MNLKSYGQVHRAERVIHYTCPNESILRNKNDGTETVPNGDGRSTDFIHQAGESIRRSAAMESSKNAPDDGKEYSD